ncbi:MAG TPA: WD40 repeat domain-containing protein [Bacteroidales bacterium]|nr:WD40 repeat domain-containing protein [Bacteroidales bacterium]
MNESRTPINPFPGIRSYEIEEESLFFGRDRVIRELVTLMTTTHFVALTGASGCGKSSLIKAGLIPALIRQKGKDTGKGWEYAIFRPGDDPIGQMAEALYQMIRTVAGEQNPLKTSHEVEKILRSDREGILRLFQMVPFSLENRKLLLIIDQFEELFRYKGSSTTTFAQKDADQLVELLLRALGQDTLPVYILLSMRSDFIDQCTDYQGLTEKINQGYYLVPRMTRQDIREAIAGPVEVGGAQIAERLVNRLLDEVSTDPDHLPILQHALMRTWEKWSQTRTSDPQIDEQHYESIGTMQQALSLHAEEIFASLGDQRQQTIAEKLFKALVVVGQDSKGIRRPTQLGEICDIAKAKPQEVIEVVDCFRSQGRSFLMPPTNVALNEDSIIDMTHESLMRIWKRLRTWVEEETNSAQLYLRLSKSAELYQEGKTGLWVDPELHLATKWKENTHPNQAWANRYDPAFDRAVNFLDYSRKEADLALSRKEEHQKRELVRARRFAIILGVASAISIFFLIISINLTFKAEASEKKSLEKENLAKLETLKAAEQRKEAIIQRRISEQQQQIAEQQKIITEEQKEFAIQQQQIAFNERKEAIFQRQLAEESKNEAVQARDYAQEQGKIALEQKGIAEAERAKAEASEKNARRLRLLAVANAMAVKSVEIQESVEGDLPALLALEAYHMNQQNEGPKQDPDIFKALSGVNKGDILLWIHQNEVRSVAVGKKTGSLYSCSLDGTVRITDYKNPDHSVRVMKDANQGQEEYFSLALSHDERYLAAGTNNGDILLWDLNTRDPQPVIHHGHTFLVTHLCFNPVTGELASSSADGSVRLWNPAKENDPGTIIDKNIHRMTVTCFSPDGNVLSWANEKGEIKAMNLKSMMVSPFVIQASGMAVYALAFSEDGNILVSGDASGTIRLWEADRSYHSTVSLIGHLSRISDLVFSPDGQILGSSSYDGTIRLWNFRSPEEPPIVMDDYDFWITCMAFSPDGKSLVSGSADKTIRIRLIDMETLAGRLCTDITRNMTREEWILYVGSDIEYSRTCINLP